MRSGLKLRLVSDYTLDEHKNLIKNLERIGRDHYHYRHGVKTKLHYMNICTFDFISQSIKGHLSGPDSDKVGRSELIDIRYRVTVGKSGNPIIHIDYSDRTTSYEQSIGLIEHALSRMARNSKEFENEHPFNGNLNGLYLFSAKNKGFHKDFDNVFEYAKKNLILAPSFKDSLKEIGYDLQLRESR